MAWFPAPSTILEGVLVMSVCLRNIQMYKVMHRMCCGMFGVSYQDFASFVCFNCFFGCEGQLYSKYSYTWFNSISRNKCWYTWDDLLHNFNPWLFDQEADCEGYPLPVLHISNKKKSHKMFSSTKMLTENIEWNNNNKMGTKGNINIVLSGSRNFGYRRTIAPS